MYLFFNWKIIALQRCVLFYHTSTWISQRYMYVPSFPLPAHPTTLGCHRARSLISPQRRVNFHWQSILHTVMYMFQCYCLNSFHSLYILLPELPTFSGFVNLGTVLYFCFYFHCLDNPLVAMGHLIFLNALFFFKNERKQSMLFTYSLAMLLAFFSLTVLSCNPPHTNWLLCHHPYYTVLLSSPLILPDFTGWLENPFVSCNPPNTISTINQTLPRTPFSLPLSFSLSVATP